MRRTLPSGIYGLLPQYMERRFRAAEAMRHACGESPIVAKLLAQGLLP